MRSPVGPAAFGKEILVVSSHEDRWHCAHPTKDHVSVSWWFLQDLLALELACACAFFLPLHVPFCLSKDNLHKPKREGEGTGKGKF